jgi:putative ABC transport system substrate-binding protein
MPAGARGRGNPVIARRRLLIAAGLVTVFRPVGTRAQYGRKVWRIGFLSASSRSASLETGFESFLAGLRELGYVEGSNLEIEGRFADGDSGRLPALAAELVRQDVDLILAWATPAALAAQRATATIPIVIIGVADPMGSGLVAALARPGGNVTGVSNLSRELSAKMVELLLAVALGNDRIAVLRVATNPSSALQLREIEAAARAINRELLAVEVRSPSDLDEAFASMSRARAIGVIVLPEPLVLGERQRIANLAIRHRLPTIFARRENVEVGGLMCYGASLPDQYRHVASYVGRILKDARPADLPVEQPTKFELVINLKTAKALGFTIPQALLLRADEVIQ